DDWTPGASLRAAVEVPGQRVPVAAAGEGALGTCREGGGGASDGPVREGDGGGKGARRLSPAAARGERQESGRRDARSVDGHAQRGLVERAGGIEAEVDRPARDGGAPGGRGGGETE